MDELTANSDVAALKLRSVSAILDARQMEEMMRFLVVGATGGSGRAVVEELVSAGHDVTAFSRRVEKVAFQSERVRTVKGDAMNPADVDAAVRGHDAVIVTLGISESALRVRLFGSTTTPINVRSAGTRNVIAAMKRHGVSRLVVQTSFGVGETRARLPLLYRLMFRVLLKQQIEDTEAQEREVRASGLEWILAQPVNLTDDDGQERILASAEGETARMKISRRSVARFLAQTAATMRHAGRSVALSST